ncbi:hypothetical protein BH20ACT2_BH20ACT2_19780 [soil metagenome]
MKTADALQADLQAPTRWPALEGIRGIAVLAVVAYHATRLVLTRAEGNWDEGISWLWWWMATGRFGVDVFFVLAGFLVVASWASARQRTASLGAAARDFAARRAWRVLPPYWVSLLVLVPLVAPQLLGVDGWGDLARLVTVQQYFDTDLPSEVNVVYWSLTTEVHFYFLVPLVAWLLHRVGGWPLVLAAVGLGLWWAHSDGRGELPASFIGGRLHHFVIGAAAGQLVRRHLAGASSRLVRVIIRPGVGWALALSMVGLGIYHGATYGRPDTKHIEGTLHIVASFVLAALVIRLVCGPGGTVCDRPWPRFFGLISYSIYLWHFPVLEHGLPVLGLASDGTTTGSLAGLAAAMLVLLSLGAGLLAYLLVERPFLKLQSRRRSRGQSHEAPAEPKVPTPT